MAEEAVTAGALVSKSVYDVENASVTIQFEAHILEEIARIVYEYPDFVLVNRDASTKMLEFLEEALRAGTELRDIVKGKLDESSVSEVEQQGG